MVMFKLGFSQFYDTDATVYTTSKIEKRKEMWVKLGEKEILIGMHISRRRRGESSSSNRVHHRKVNKLPLAFRLRTRKTITFL